LLCSTCQTFRLPTYDLPYWLVGLGLRNHLLGSERGATPDDDDDDQSGLINLLLVCIWAYDILVID
jgi:hypothetical protein